jgi:Holliday junction resolvasome RuvABC DNA-binding subunit
VFPGISSKTAEEMVVTLKGLQMEIHNTKEGDPSLRDWLADLIWAILGYTVG